MLGLLIVVALALLLFGIVGGIAISKFLFLLLLVAAVIFLIGLFTRFRRSLGCRNVRTRRSTYRRPPRKEPRWQLHVLLRSRA